MSNLPRVQHQFDVCIIGGGMAGLIAAIASARHGARTCLVHDRAVLGGNASSEVRMWICGSHAKHLKETGILEEIQLENYHRNPSLNYSIWDSVLYGKAFFEPNLTTFLNTTCNDAAMKGDAIESITAWTLTSQTWQIIHAKQFIDCSGDGILGGITPAQYSTGRESREAFNEDIQPAQADQKTMGNSILIQMRKTDEPQPFVPPKWAYKFTSPDDIPCRMNGVQGTNFWWIELGGLQDTIVDAEDIRDQLMRTVYGLWDYIKNHAPAKADATNWAIEWVGSLPGKRESRRFVGDHVLTQNDIRNEGRFDDVICHGGWPMDDHHPAGLLYPGPPTVFHPAPACYGIPLRCLYSRNISNMLFAGRNISVTHAALSSTRVMATTSLLGQAAGTAAALAVKHNTTPRSLASGPLLEELQQILMDDDILLPFKKRSASELAKTAKLSAGALNAGDQNDAAVLLDGSDRDTSESKHAWEGSVDTPIEFRWVSPVKVGGVRIIFDSNLANNKRQPCSYPQKGNRCLVPGSLVKHFVIEAQNNDGGKKGSWSVVHEEKENILRLCRVRLDVHTQAIRLIVKSTWGDETVRIFSFEPQETTPWVVTTEDGPHWRDVVSKIDPADLAPPDSGLEKSDKVRLHGA